MHIYTLVNDQKFSSSFPFPNFRLLLKLKSKTLEQLSLEINTFKLSGGYIKSTEIHVLILNMTSLEIQRLK
jgi:hypothetical protein